MTTGFARCDRPQAIAIDASSPRMIEVLPGSVLAEVPAKLLALFS